MACDNGEEGQAEMMSEPPCPALRGDTSIDCPQPDTLEKFPLHGDTRKSQGMRSGGILRGRAPGRHS